MKIGMNAVLEIPYREIYPLILCDICTLINYQNNKIIN